MPIHRKRGMWLSIALEVFGGKHIRNTERLGLEGPLIATTRTYGT